MFSIDFHFTEYWYTWKRIFTIWIATNNESKLENISCYCRDLGSVFSTHSSGLCGHWTHTVHIHTLKYMLPPIPLLYLASNYVAMLESSKEPGIELRQKHAWLNRKGNWKQTCPHMSTWFSAEMARACVEERMTFLCCESCIFIQNKNRHPHLKSEI